MVSLCIQTQNIVVLNNIIIIYSFSIKIIELIIE